MMSKDTIRELLSDPRLGLDPGILSPETVEAFASYVELWQKWNDRVNLTAEHSPTEFLQKHIFISCQYLQGLVPDSRLMDIGSGAGLPGIPLKILAPGIQLTLVESRGKRANFMQTVIRQLKLANAEVQSCRAEDLPDAYRGAFDVVVFRAVASLADCLQLGSPFLRSGGMLRLLKVADESPGDQTGFTPCPALPVVGFHNEPLSLLSFIKE